MAISIIELLTRYASDLGYRVESASDVNGVILFILSKEQINIDTANPWRVQCAHWKETEAIKPLNIQDDPK